MSIDRVRQVEKFYDTLRLGSFISLTSIAGALQSAVHL